MNLADQLKRAIDAAGRQPPPGDLWIKLPLSLAQRLYQVICQLHGFQPPRMSLLIERIEQHIIIDIEGIVGTPPKQWTKRALHDHLQAVRRDLERASGAQTGLP